MEKENCCGHRVKERSTAEYKDLINRLNRIEGQVRGIKKMVENNAYCPDVLVQSAAVSAAMFALVTLLREHYATALDITVGATAAFYLAMGNVVPLLSLFLKRGAKHAEENGR